ncbi:MAG: hypothetical protein COT15_01240 [Candidatus Diapherotrites archaeon CG08_land_8_20_14_0_20_34_12]|nr:MAG: hypothetical protein COT15_01240 [Candidatus Diapherotrites archaeon CG08_land_8_20_14_0_20_34_12]
MSEQLGSIAFILGVLLAIVAAVGGSLVAEYMGYVTLLLVVLGLIVGFLNVSDKELIPFLVATIALMSVGNATLLPLDAVLNPLGTYLQGIVSQIVVFVAPAAIILALKAIYVMGKTVDATK